MHAILEYNHTEDGEFQEFPGYRETALAMQMEGEPEGSADIVYLGDDHKETGNDYAGFLAVSMEKALCVTTEKDAKKWATEIESDVVVQGGPEAVGQITERILQKRQLTGKTVPLFSHFCNALRTIFHLTHTTLFSVPLIFHSCNEFLDPLHLTHTTKLLVPLVFHYCNGFPYITSLCPSILF